MSNYQKHLPLLLYLYVILLPLQGFSVLTISGRGLGRLDWLGGLLLVSGFLLYQRRGRFRIRYSRVNKFVLFYLLTSFISLFNLFNASNSQLIDYGTKFLSLLVVIVVFYVISSIDLKDDEQLRRLFQVWYGTAFVVSLYGLYQLIARPFGLPFSELGLSNLTLSARGIQTYRIYSGYAQISSFFKEPGWLGTYLLSAIVPFGIIILNNQDQYCLFRSQNLNRIILITLVVTLLLTGALGPILFFAISLTLFLIFRVIPRTRLVFSFLILLALVGLGTGYIQTKGIDIISYTQRRWSGLYLNILDPQNTAQITSFKNRSDRTLAALQVWAEHPLTGVGMNNVGYYNWKFVDEDEDVGAINNGWISLLAEQGLLGFFAMLAVVISTVLNLRSMTHQVIPRSWRYYLLNGFMWLVLIEAVNTGIAFSWIHPLRWFTLSVANLVLIEARERFQPEATLERKINSAGIEFA